MRKALSKTRPAPEKRRQIDSPSKIDCKKKGPVGECQILEAVFVDGNIVKRLICWELANKELSYFEGEAFQCLAGNGLARRVRFGA